jgi:hypothetical protein
MTGLCGVSQGAVVISVNEVFNDATSQTDIVFNWTGALDLTGATQGSLLGGFAAIVRPQQPLARLFSSGNTQSYVISGPGAGVLGDGDVNTFLTTTSGNTSMGIANSGTTVSLSQTYTSGSPIFGESILAGNTFAGIGLNLGSYVWTVTGSNDTITMNVIPEPSTAAIFAGLACGLFATYRRVHVRRKRLA